METLDFDFVGGILSIDSIYYPGVLQFIKAVLLVRPDAAVYVLVNHYNTSKAMNGKVVPYFNGEGKFVVNYVSAGEHGSGKHTVLSTPKDNSVSYVHEVFPGNCFRQA
jgi:hypothetical protein